MTTNMPDFLNDPTYRDVPASSIKIVDPAGSPVALPEASYKVYVKRSDLTYRIFMVINSIFVCLVVAAVVCMFGLLAYGMFVLSDTLHVLEVMQAQNQPAPPPAPTP